MQNLGITEPPGSMIWPLRCQIFVTKDVFSNLTAVSRPECVILCVTTGQLPGEEREPLPTHGGCVHRLYAVTLFCPIAS